MQKNNRDSKQSDRIRRPGALAGFRALARLELCNIYGLNVFRFTKNKKAKRKSVGLAFLWLLLLGMIFFYMGGLSYGLIVLGLQDVVFAYLIAISSMMILVFGMLKAGSVMFRKEGYDMLCALPMLTRVVVLGRILRMYVENLGLALAVLLPGIIVYAWNVHPDAIFYLTIILSTLSVPMIPIAVAILIGALITGIASRMRHKSLVAAGLSILAVLVILVGSSRISAMEGNMNLEMLKSLSEHIFRLLRKLYAPAVWFGEAVVYGNLVQCLLCVCLSIAVIVAVTIGISLCFHRICQNLYGGFAKHDYRAEDMGNLKENSLFTSLCGREFRRYFASSIYVTNTIIGPIMGCVLSGAVLVMGVDSLTGILPLPVDVPSLVPFVLAGVFCTMTTTSTSISMEGKNWWILKGLPLSMKQILDAKIGMNLLLILPFYVLSEGMLVVALRPGGMELLWLLLIPAVLIVFSCVYGITVNLQLPVLDWENEVSVVKQSASALLGGMGGFVLALLCMLCVIVLPGKYGDIVKMGICVVLILTTGILYRRNNRYDLRRL